MVQPAARADVGAPPPAGRAEELGRDWLVLRDCRLRPSDRGVLPSVLIHPARGVAVLDILPSKTPGAAEAVRARLHAARFPAIFAGHLPVAHVQATPRQMPFLPALLDDAFAAQPPLRLPGGDAWVGVAARALTAEQPVPRLQSRRFRSAAKGRRRRRAAFLRAVGAVLLCAAALGGVLALAVKEAPEPAPAPVAAVAPAPPQDAALPAPPPVPEPGEAVSPPPPVLGGAEAAAPQRDEPPPAPLPEEPSPAPQHPPQRAASPPPPAKKPAERAAPRRQREAGAAPPAADATPPQLPAAGGGAQQRCGRITAELGLGAPLGDADMRFFNENCIRW